MLSQPLQQKCEELVGPLQRGQVGNVGPVDAVGVGQRLADPLGGVPSGIEVMTPDQDKHRSGEIGQALERGRVELGLVGLA
jgi:hypothetical protein